MTDWEYDTENNSGRLSLLCELTIREVSDLKSRFIEVFDIADHVTIDVSSVKNVDVAGLQILCACHGFACSMGKSMSLQYDGNDEFAFFLKDTGFTQDYVCRYGENKDCLWPTAN